MDISYIGTLNTYQLEVPGQPSEWLILYLLPSYLLESYHQLKEENKIRIKQVLCIAWESNSKTSKVPHPNFGTNI